MSDVPVVVVGAGPTGVTAALMLAHAGVEVVVIDRWPEVFPQPRAAHLDDEVFRILTQVGVGEQLAATTRPAKGMQLQSRDRAVLAEFSRAPEGPHGFPQANMFDQPVLEGLLRATMHDTSRIRFVGDAEVTRVVDEGDAVRIHLADRQTAETDVLRAAYVLGCDGAGSRTRAAIGARMRDLRFRQRWLVVDVDIDDDLGHWEGIHQVCDSEFPATFMRGGERRYRWEFKLKDGQSAADFDTIEKLRPLIEPWLVAAPQAEPDLIRVADYTFRAEVADRWRRGRVFLLGDAAHLTPPFIGQGMGAGLRDALNLTWKLAAVIDGSLPEAVLETYEAERRPHVIRLILTAIGVGVAMTRGGSAGDRARRAIAPHLTRIPGLRDFADDSATPRLGPSALAPRRRGERGLVGRTCPNAVLADGRRFDDVAAGAYAILTTGEVGARDHELAADRAATLLSVSRADGLGDWLHEAGVTAVLIRPDGVVQAAGPDVSVLVRQLTPPPLTSSHPARATPAAVPTR